MCREEGLALSELAARSDKPLDGFELFGIVKETGVDDEGLREFHSKFYDYPLYKNEGLEFYKALGSGKLGFTSMLKLLFGYRSVTKRMKSKNIDGNLVGEGLVKGGVIIFDKKGKPKYSYQEVTGNQMPVDDIAAAVQSIKEES